MKRALFGLLGALTAVASLAAHHSFSADYFEEQTVTLEGDVVSFELVNPHSFLRIAVLDQDGQPQTYSGEWSNPARLKQAGFTPASFKPGEHLVLTGSPARNAEERRFHLRTIRRPADGWKWPKSGRDDDP